VPIDDQNARMNAFVCLDSKSVDSLSIALATKSVDKVSKMLMKKGEFSGVEVK
jgi:hypothetical protein